jgi:hypothetical protein
MANPWTAEAWNVTEQVRIIKTQGMPAAEKLAAEAGTSVNGPKPKQPVPPRVTNVFNKGGVSAFTKLTDTPRTYAGAEGKLVAVNGAGTALEFVDPAVAASEGLINQAPASDVTLPANYALIAMVEYTLGVGVSLIFGPNAMMRII